ncbi:polysaccharide pyruvyl transferase family protein [Aeromicrobium sp. Marseille-Q0843]|uniref:Polysaccharide pyruvyl transferase family protein n=1 Tax=Aeromicrobium phoceense TaxID=2754045 RepID=A0A838X7W1_9ACTN|nr:polysaccharide pyruvyl transferase family protein [Aeromicrobium phoceense]
MRHALRRRWDLYTDPTRRDRVAAVRELGTALSTDPQARVPHAGPSELRELAAQYRLASDALLVDGHVPLVWWTHTANFGDLLSPWLVGLLTGRPVTYARPGQPAYLAVGSIVGEARKDSIVWGSGAFGSEGKWGITAAKSYRAVRGPLTRSRLRNIGLPVPRVYGDPALLSPLVYWPEVEKDAEVGIVVRWSESRWTRAQAGDGVRIIDLGSSDVTSTLRDLISCKRILSSSLHGLILADAYGIANAWLDSDGGAGGSRPAGGEFKFYDYMASVDKLRHAQSYTLGDEPLEADRLLDALEFSGAPIDFDHAALLDACPFLERIP